MSDQIISRIDDMGTRIDDLEHNINDLMAQVFKFHKNMNFHIMSATFLTKVNIAGGSERRPSSLGKQRPGGPQVILAGSCILFIIQTKPTVLIIKTEQTTIIIHTKPFVI